GDELPGLAALPATLESGADRAADITREGLSGARQGLERAGDALAMLWGEVGRRVDGDEPPASGDGETPAAIGGNAETPVAVTGNAETPTAAGGDAGPQAAQDGTIENEAVPDAELS